MKPTISMDPRVHYVTQSAAYDRLGVGRVLTNRRITQLQKAGYYKTVGPILPAAPKATATIPRRTTTPKVTLKQLIDRYGI